ncbi:S-methyl-5-thioribose-1-phosphate isomerase [Tengunoibacter tsumagoiensis]|uniref:Methylthioribose-1-phosphate isomerase n=1 Tax=Tengunoibacter tsumagoiensis TaxID=2014871 RepID=A0A402A2A1_9CHLR|nr:S-methyl-5-thioribose-1-phosphate isomerase [Tengunoibacter tsumagoiensis]GCE13273.1 methylthioribose-1-phosphate isomerase [Tengunoibacter tsumagoiensis]
MDDQLQPPVRTVWWNEDPSATPSFSLGLLDQTLLPQQVVELSLTHELAVAEAITSLRVRGAPAIGVTAAFGLALALRRIVYDYEQQGHELSLALAQEQLFRTAQLLRQTRPTAVNLAWALERMLLAAQSVLVETSSVAALVERVQMEAHTIAAEDAAACLQMGRYGASLIVDGMSLLTHCNAGALATSGLGSALAPIYTAQRQGKQLHVYVDETRPVLQGARLTAWELQRSQVPCTLITDNMAGTFMRQGKIQAIFVGADRITANGDIANKIGTYSVAVLAQAHGIPLYVVAPCSTIDLALETGDGIPIEQRDPGEVSSLGGQMIAPLGVAIANPAFDVTPHHLISAIITEKGIARSPYVQTLQQMCAISNEKVSSLDE